MALVVSVTLSHRTQACPHAVCCRLERLRVQLLRHAVRPACWAADPGELHHQGRRRAGPAVIEMIPLHDGRQQGRPIDHHIRADRAALPLVIGQAATPPSRLRCCATEGAHSREMLKKTAARVPTGGHAPPGRVAGRRTARHPRPPRSSLPRLACAAPYMDYFSGCGAMQSQGQGQWGEGGPGGRGEIETLATSTNLSIRQIQKKITGRASRSTVGEITKRARAPEPPALWPIVCTYPEPTRPSFR